MKKLFDSYLGNVLLLSAVSVMSVGIVLGLLAQNLQMQTGSSIAVVFAILVAVNYSFIRTMKK